MHFLSAIFAVASLFGAVQADSPQGVIISPPGGIHIAPGQSFPFTYNARIGQCASSYNYTVWLFTSPPETFMTSNTTGVFLGRFSAASYDANPFPENRAPENLTMPNFTARRRGFAVGKSAANLKVWLTVLEEWKDCTPQVGNTLTPTSVQLIYNATTGE